MKLVLLHLKKKKMIFDDELNDILRNVADNFLISLDSTFEKLYFGLDPQLWSKSNNNPILFLKKYKRKIIAKDYNFNIEEIVNRYYEIINSPNNKSGKSVAYFSPEFGFHESFPNYAGGLGVLAGDVIKTAAMSEINMVGVGLLYSKGYFVQSLSTNKQRASYRKIDLENLPIEKLLDKSGNEVSIDMEIGEHNIKVIAYRLRIHNSSVILLSTDDEAIGKMRVVTEKLYTGDRYLRLLQEIILGIGGVRVLSAAGIDIDQYHINEGHASFAIWERAAIYAKNNGITISQALDLLRESTTFTTHTPVVHGNEEFAINKLKDALKYILNDFDKNFNTFINLGKTKSIDEEMFSMTAFGINLAGISNGVSQLHGDTAAKMWSEIYEDNKNIKPMTYVTNGIHFNSWMSDEIRTIVEKNRIDETNVEKIIESYSTENLFTTKQKLKTNMFERLKNLPQISDDNYFFQHNSLESLKGSLVIGFARRFAPYKRADLIFGDYLNLLRIMEDLEIPVVMIFSGKAHPKDVDGKKLLSQVIDQLNFKKLKNHILFVPDYDILVGRLLVQGCDVWLNNPIKPLEACGTSGMKSSLNFGVNLSVDDGWWHEAYNGRNGFVLDGNLDKVEITQKIYDLLENKIIPDYAKAQRGESYEWYEFMKQSFLTAYHQFSSERMLKEYSGKLYEV